MVTMAQRITQLRTQRGLSCQALSAAMGLPRMAVEKFENGRQTPTREQQQALADYFQVSLFYLRGESSDPTRQDSWMDQAWEEEPAPAPAPASRPRAARPAPKGEGEQNTVFDSLLRTPAFQEMVRATVLQVLRSPEGQEILERTLRRELDRQR